MTEHLHISSRAYNVAVSRLPSEGRCSPNQQSQHIGFSIHIKLTPDADEVAEESNGKSDAIDTQQGSVIANEVDVADAVDIIIEDSDFV